MIAVAMSGRRRLPSVLAMLLWLAAGAIASLAGVLALAEQSTGWSHDVGVLGEAALAVAIATAGVWIVAREARSAVGWIVCGLGVALATSAFSGEYVTRELAGGASPRAFVEGVAIAGYLSFPAMVLAAPFLLLLGPASRRGERSRWLVALRLAVAGAASLGLLLLIPGPLKGFTAIDNPLGLSALDGVRGLALWAWLPIALLTIGLAVVPVPRRKVANVQGQAAEAESLEPPVKEELPSPWATWRYIPRIFPYLRPYRAVVAGTILLTAVTVVVGLAQPWPLAFMVDSVLGKHHPPSLVTHVFGTSNYALLIFAAAAGLALALFTNLIAVAHDYLSTKLEARLALDFRSDLFWHAQRLSVDYHDRRPTGQLMNQMIQEADAAGGLMLQLLPMAQSMLMVIGMFLIALTIDVELALLSLVIIPIIYYSVSFYSKRIVPVLVYVRGLEWQSASIIFESMAMLRVVAAFAREPYEFKRFRAQGTIAAKARVGLTVRQALFSLWVNTCIAAGTALILGVGALHVLHGGLTVGQLLVILYYIGAIYGPLETISSAMSSMQQQLVAVQGAFMLLDTDPDITDAPDAVSLGRARGAVAFESVDFSYQEREETLKQISFSIESGEHVALVGPTGAGKTTLVNLIQRFHDPKDGCVKVDGLDVRQVQLRSLREQISVVLQVPELFSGTIADNIRYGRLDATIDEVVSAAEAANALDFIDRFPARFDTALGEGGAQMSVGERQRICVARAFLKDAPILILDEPTSSIDSRTERVILDALDELMKGRTTFMIAHRLSTIRHADRILVMNHGELVEMGTHEELVANDGLYRELHDAQSGSHKPASQRGNGESLESGESAVMRRLVEALEARTSKDKGEA